MGKKVNMVGRIFGRWKVLSEDPIRTRSGTVKYLCMCECGNMKSVSGSILRKGESTSCGCYNRDVITKEAPVYKERLHNVWNSMKQRCNNPRDKAYKNYGSRGIKVCESWSKDYLAFRKWALSSGYKQGLWLDRIDNEKGYCPENCRWTSPGLQARNKRTTVMVEIDGVSKCITDWSAYSGVPACTIARRMELGWTKDKLLCPVDRRFSHGHEIREGIKRKHNPRVEIEIREM